MSSSQSNPRHTGLKSQFIKASVLHGPKDLRVEERSISLPSPDEVQVTILATGLCGSDLHYYSDFRNGDILVQEPLTLGHESAGVVVAIGEAVTDLQIGDNVALEVGTPCDQCDLCNEGRYNLCKGMVFRSSARKFPHAQGTLQERINHPAKWCHKLPEGISPVFGALLEPLGVAIHAVRRAKLRPQSNVLVFGAGTVGLLTAAVARRAGARVVVSADIDRGRLDFALQNEFVDVAFPMPTKRGSTVEESIAIAKETASRLTMLNLPGKDAIGEFDVIFECTGVSSPMHTAIFAAKPGSRIMIVGMGSPTMTIPLMAASSKEVDLIGVFRYADTYQEGIKMLSESIQNGTDFSKLVTHRFTGLGEAPAAFQMAGNSRDASGNLVIKVVLENQEASNVT